MLKSATILILLMSPVCAQEALTQEEINMEMCGYKDQHYDAASHECIYCAHGMHRDKKTNECVGTPDVIGKCYANDHYHPKTKECMHCAKGYGFDETSRACEEKQ